MHGLYSNLIEYWPLHEASGDRYGCVLQTQMTDTNTVTRAVGPVVWGASFASASSERLLVASNSNIQTGDIDFTWACWVYLTTNAASQYFIGKDNTSGTGREYVLNYNQSTNRFNFNVFRSGPTAAGVAADVLGAPATATWYFLTAWHDANGDTVNLQVNNLAPDSAASGGALQAAGAAALNFGARSDASVFLNGRMAEVGFWKRVLTPAERHWLYNGGQGRTYPFDGRPAFPMLEPHARRVMGMVA